MWELHPKSTCADFFPSSLPCVYSFRIRRRNKVRYHFPLRYPTGLDAVPSLAYRLSSRLAARSLCVPISCLQTNGERTCCTTSFQVVPRAFYRGPPTINTPHLFLLRSPDEIDIVRPTIEFPSPVFFARGTGGLCPRLFPTVWIGFQSRRKPSRKHPSIDRPFRVATFNPATAVSCLLYLVQT